MSEFERIVTFDPAFDRRHSNPSKNYGVHGVDMRMVLRGPKGATQFVLYTGWQLPHVEDSEPLAADFGYHWHRARYEGQEPMTCSYLPCGQCYYDGSGLRANDLFDVLRKEGGEGVWRELEKFYRELEAEDKTP
jgi:hypothetical protein